ncbi:NEW3 domain-containing protein [Streptomyces zhihengii]
MSVTAKVPGGWKATTAQRSPLVIDSGHLPVQKKVTLDITVPPGAVAGSYPVEVKVEGRGRIRSPARPLSRWGPPRPARARRTGSAQWT